MRARRHYYGTTRVTPVSEIRVVSLFFEVFLVMLLCSDSHSEADLTILGGGGRKPSAVKN